MVNHSFKNHFLIAMPSVVDSFFYRSVVYIYEHDEQGATGIIINRPTQVSLEELLSHLNIHNLAEATKTTHVLFGGPVQKNQGMILHDQVNSNWKSSTLIANNVMLTTSTDILESIGTDLGPKNSLVALGCANWNAGQLEKEILENDWLTVSAKHDLIFKTPTKNRWSAASKLLGIDINLISSMSGHA